MAPSRPWLVSTSGERIVVFHGNKRTDVLSNGSYEISDLTSGKRSKDALNIDLLSQAIKHLSRFSTQN
ncbi:Membrane-associated hydrolase of alkaline phosphatase superfamily protein [marine sediment metagenome]|uniref:Membrane-associated hydrolase of alkaline phosphatase superfamily protein n=1 Tax=marine sediment metagenome TaxID=412755 RepID=A0A1B6NXA5_9ZZZZ